MASSSVVVLLGKLRQKDVNLRLSSWNCFAIEGCRNPTKRASCSESLVGKWRCYLYWILSFKVRLSFFFILKEPVSFLFNMMP